MVDELTIAKQAASRVRSVMDRHWRDDGFTFMGRADRDEVLQQARVEVKNAALDAEEWIEGECLKRDLNDSHSYGLMVELVLGHGGFVLLPDDYLSPGLWERYAEEWREQQR